MLLSDYDRLQFRLDAGNQPCEAYYLLLELGHPQVLRADLRQVLVEPLPGIVAAYLRAIEDLPVPFG